VRLTDVPADVRRGGGSGLGHGTPDSDARAGSGGEPEPGDHPEAEISETAAAGWCVEDDDLDLMLRLERALTRQLDRDADVAVAHLPDDKRRSAIHRYRSARDKASDRAFHDRPEEPTSYHILIYSDLYDKIQIAESMPEAAWRVGLPVQIDVDQCLDTMRRLRNELAHGRTLEGQINEGELSVFIGNVRQLTEAWTE